MNGRRAVIGLSLLCALLFSAFAAQSASATVGTTAFTCVEGGNKDFADAHCDEAVEAGKGKFGHAEIGEETTSVELTNAKTTNKTTEAKHALLKSTSGGIAIEITCATVLGEGSLKNIAAGPDGGMAVEGKEGGTLNFTNCKMPKPINGAKEELCKVVEPIKTTGSSITRVNQTTGEIKNTMGVEFKPTVKEKVPQPFVEIAFENVPGKVCFLNGKVIPVTGTAMATGARGPSNSVNSSGATLLFTTAMTKETLKFGAAAAEFEATVTVSMTNADKKTTENPVTLTTTAT
jgi:hypothetical protein